MESLALWEFPICSYWALESHAASRPPWNFTRDLAIQTLILTPVLQALYLLSHIPQSNVLKNRKRGVETNSNEKKMDTHGVVNQESKGKGTVRARDNKM